MKIAVIGAGHAGVTAALEAAKFGADVSLLSDENALPYYRPKITNVAFGQAESGEISIHPSEWYDENKIKLVLKSKIEKIDPQHCSLWTSSGQPLQFDKIIITTGACPIIPKFTEGAIQKGYASTLWNIKDSLLIREKLKNIKELAIIGGGVIGIECALRASDVGIKVTIIEKSDALMQKNLSIRGSQVLKQALQNKGIETLTSTTVENITQTNNKASIKTEEKLLFFDHIILSIGCLPNAGFIQANGVYVNNYMASNLPNIYSAGDSAVVESAIAPFSVLNAINQGKIAGYNASTSNSPIKFQNSPATVDIKYNDFELHAVGYSTESLLKNESVLEENGNIYRSILRDTNSILGIQMIGSSKDFNLYRKQLKTI
ncbi:MAG: NAD(P)/FAD-dependent oxidoreductase [Lentisphaerota bacterium]